MPRVSVIIPTYNRANLISETIDSVLDQTYKDYEIIVIDDGSTDNTQEVLSLYGERIKIIQQNNQGQGPARNTGIKSSRGEWIAFLDSDDLWKPNKLKEQVDFLKNKPNLAWVYSDAEVFEDTTGLMLYSFGERQRLYEGDILEKLLIQDFIPSPTPLINKKVFEHVGYFLNYESAQDWDMWIRIAEYYPIGLISESLALYRKHPGNITSSLTWEKKYSCRIDIIKNAIERNPEQLKKVKDLAISNIKLGLCKSLLQEGNKVDARRLIIAAIKLHPLLFFQYIYLLGSYFPLSMIQALVVIKRNIRIFLVKKRFNY